MLSRIAVAIVVIRRLGHHHIPCLVWMSCVCVGPDNVKRRVISWYSLTTGDSYARTCYSQEHQSDGRSGAKTGKVPVSGKTCCRGASVDGAVAV